MKATEEFNQDFRPKTRSKNVEEQSDPLTHLSTNDVLLRAQLTFVRFGLAPVIFS